jgi:hypothetical protein
LAVDSWQLKVSNGGLTATDRRQKAEGRKKKRQKKEDRQGRGKAK